MWFSWTVNWNNDAATSTINRSLYQLIVPMSSFGAIGSTWMGGINGCVHVPFRWAGTMALVTAIPLTLQIPTPTLTCMVDGSTDWHQVCGGLSVRMVGLVKWVLIRITSGHVLLVGKAVSAKLVRSWWYWIFVMIYDTSVNLCHYRNTHMIK